LSHARTIGMRVAFVRRVAETQLFGIHDKGPRWFPGFIPRRADMVFDRDRPSCYASAAFADVMKGRNMQYVVAGLFGDSACLATAVDAFHRDHRLTYLADASTSRAIGNLKDSEVHRVLEGIIGKYATVLRTRDWIGLNAYARSRQR
jgi:isochorismate hydrolase